MKHVVVPDPENLQTAAEKKAARRAKKNRPAMQVTGKGVFELQKILQNKKPRSK